VPASGACGDQCCMTIIIYLSFQFLSRALSKGCTPSFPVFLNPLFRICIPIKIIHFYYFCVRSFLRSKRGLSQQETIPQGKRFCHSRIHNIRDVVMCRSNKSPTASTPLLHHRKPSTGFIQLLFITVDFFDGKSLLDP
jgi:hypothetical protein